MCRARRCDCTFAGETTRGRTITMYRSSTSYRSCKKPRLALYLPFANPRHAHEYKVLRGMPLGADQVLVAGVIDTVTNYIEHPEVVADRLERIVEVVGDPARVMAGTDCGFDTSAGMGRVAEDVVWSKLGAMVEGSRIASRRLFGS